jgi:RecA-family ATPase
MTEEKAEITLGGFKLDTPGAKEHRLSMLIWGSSGAGKTTLAATAPGKKLWISFDPDGTASIADNDDVIVLDLAKEPDRVVEKFKDNDPMKISKFLEENDIDTVVVDSLTSFGDKALTHGVYKAQGTSKGKSATLEDPGFSGYGNKNAWTRAIVKNMLEVTAKHKKHIIFIAHEDKPTTNDQGVVMHISIMLGSSLNEQVPLQISEVRSREGNSPDHQLRPPGS